MFVNTFIWNKQIIEAYNFEHKRLVNVTKIAHQTFNGDIFSSAVYNTHTHPPIHIYVCRAWIHIQVFVSRRAYTLVHSFYTSTTHTYNIHPHLEFHKT